MINPMKH
jgi:hypothetical protein